MFKAKIPPKDPISRRIEALEKEVARHKNIEAELATVKNELTQTKANNEAVLRRIDALEKKPGTPIKEGG